MRRTKMVSAAKMLLQYYPNREWLPSQDKVKTLLNWIVVPNGASPRIEKIFKAFEMLEQSPRLVIVGQDPYPDDRATGVAFQTVKNVYSLAQKRIADSLGIQNGLYPDWDRWITEYRVLLINAALINTGKENIGQNVRAWRPFILMVLNSLKDDVVIVCFGRRAQTLIPKMKRKSQNRIMSYPHPAARGKVLDDGLWSKLEQMMGFDYVSHLRCTTKAIGKSTEIIP